MVKRRVLVNCMMTVSFRLFIRLLRCGTEDLVVMIEAVVADTSFFLDQSLGLYISFLFYSISALHPQSLYLLQHIQDSSTFDIATASLLLEDPGLFLSRYPSKHSLFH